MNLDVQTLLVLMLTNVFTLALALPAVMGWRVSRAARFMQTSFVVQGLAWLCLLLAARHGDRVLSSIWIALLGAGFVLMGEALHGWMGQRPLRRLLWLLAVLTPLGYFITFDHYAVRVGWANFGLALQMATLCVALAWPAPQAGWRWRLLVFASLAALATVTAWRGVLGAFFTASYPHLRAPHPVNLFGAVLNHIVLVVTGIGLMVAWREESERALKGLAETDALTGLLNRRSFTDRATRQIALARRYRDDLVLLLIDIDRFKQINDGHGHLAGDRAIQAMARALRACARDGDLVGRWGGEEFCVVLLRADAQAGARFDQRLRLALDAQPDALTGIRICFSAGLATLADASVDSGVDAWMARADRALYRAKAEGRGRLVHAALPAVVGER